MVQASFCFLHRNISCLMASEDCPVATVRKMCCQVLLFLCTHFVHRRWFQPLLGFAMANLAKEAVGGMQAKLQEMHEQGKLMPERVAAAV